MNSFDVGIQIEPQYGFSYPQISEIAKKAEMLDFESIWVSDHLFMTEDSFGISCLECNTVLSALARDTDNLRLGAMVASQSYRNPALSANIAASLDNISRGRINFGVGAGWKKVEYDAYGYQFPKAYTRIKQLEEAVEIAKLLWTGKKTSFHGKYYELVNALCYPHPVQKPHIPIWIGGSGNLTLKVASKHADAINFAWSFPIEQFLERLDLLKDHCQKIGRNYNEIRKSAGLMITMAPDTKSLKSKLKDQELQKDTPYRRYLSRQLPNIVGLPNEIAEKIAEYLELGVDHIILRFNFGEEIESMLLFKDEVMNYF
jgi:alkanesulfonate monooxygenase SsuD/methylene tetrahydromethanopterin reductase-like flavin-dependent oxidoreductase (luciferase family)